MAQHNSLLRSVIRNLHGYEVSSEGGAFLIVFASPVDALAFATELQKSLLKSEWPEELHAYHCTQPEKHPAPSLCSSPPFALLMQLYLHSKLPTLTGCSEAFGWLWAFITAQRKLWKIMPLARSITSDLSLRKLLVYPVWHLDSNMIIPLIARFISSNRFCCRWSSSCHQWVLGFDKRPGRPIGRSSCCKAAWLLSTGGIFYCNTCRPTHFHFFRCLLGRRARFFALGAVTKMFGSTNFPAFQGTLFDSKHQKISVAFIVIGCTWPRSEEAEGKTGLDGSRK